MSRVSRFSLLTERQYQVLSQMCEHFEDQRLTWRVNTLYALEKLGFVEKTWYGNDRLWRRTEKGSAELNRLIGGKD